MLVESAEALLDGDVLSNLGMIVGGYVAADVAVSALDKNLPVDLPDAAYGGAVAVGAEEMGMRLVAHGALLHSVGHLADRLGVRNIAADVAGGA